MKGPVYRFWHFKYSHVCDGLLKDWSFLQSRSASFIVVQFKGNSHRHSMVGMGLQMGKTKNSWVYNCLVVGSRVLEWNLIATIGKQWKTSGIEWDLAFFFL